MTDVPHDLQYDSKIQRLKSAKCTVQSAKCKCKEQTSKTKIAAAQT